MKKYVICSMNTCTPSMCRNQVWQKNDIYTFTYCIHYFLKIPFILTTLTLHALTLFSWHIGRVQFEVDGLASSEIISKAPPAFQESSSGV